MARQDGERPRVVVCMTTHGRVDCARINMEIVKLNYPEPWPIVHACSNSAYDKYLEDELVRCEPLPFIAGALNLIVKSFRGAADSYQPDYLIHLDADTWVFDQRVLQRYIDQLERNPRASIAASTWSTDQLPKWRSSGRVLDRIKATLVRPLRGLGVGFGIRRKNTLSTQFFITRNTPEVLAWLEGVVPVEGRMLETDFYASAVKAFGKRGIIGMPEREPVHPDNRHWCPAMTLHCQHWPEQLPRPEHVSAKVVADGTYADGISGQYEIPGKKDVLKAQQLAHLGPAMKRLLESDNLDYYNGSSKRY